MDDSLRFLREIYESEREWDKAAATTDQLLSMRVVRSDVVETEKLNKALAHYLCEQAELAYKQSDAVAAGSDSVKFLKYVPRAGHRSAPALRRTGRATNGRASPSARGGCGRDRRISRSPARAPQDARTGEGASPEEPLSAQGQGTQVN